MTEAIVSLTVTTVVLIVMVPTVTLGAIQSYCFLYSIFNKS